MTQRILGILKNGVANKVRRHEWNEHRDVGRNAELYRCIETFAQGVDASFSLGDADDEGSLGHGMNHSSELGRLSRHPMNAAHGQHGTGAELHNSLACQGSSTGTASTSPGQGGIVSLARVTSDTTEQRQALCPSGQLPAKSPAAHRARLLTASNLEHVLRDVDQ